MQLLSLSLSLSNFKPRSLAHTHINSEGKSRERVRPGLVLLSLCSRAAARRGIYFFAITTALLIIRRLNSFSAAPPFDCLRRNSLAGTAHTRARKMERLCSAVRAQIKRTQRGRREFLCSSSSSTHKINGFLLMLRRARPEHVAMATINT
jgi:hypothetical protein